MKTIEIVSHCFASKLPQYADFLTYQLSSFVFHQPQRCHLVASVCCDPDDGRTDRVIKWFWDFRIPLKQQMLEVKVHCLPPSRLGRRAIGRNYVAKSTLADIVWFADVDMVFQVGCLDRLAAMEWPDDVTMVYPRRIKIHRDHATGDRAVKRVDGRPSLVGIDESEFIDKTYNRAIGGVQIVKGDFARRHGYLDKHPKWQRPTDGGFDACRCDVPYRKFCGGLGNVKAIDLPGVYRMRHTEAGHERTPRL